MLFVIDVGNLKHFVKSTTNQKIKSRENGLRAKISVQLQYMRKRA